MTKLLFVSKIVLITLVYVCLNLQAVSTAESHDNHNGEHDVHNTATEKEQNLLPCFVQHPNKSHEKFEITFARNSATLNFNLHELADAFWHSNSSSYFDSKEKCATKCLDDHELEKISDNKEFATASLIHHVIGQCKAKVNQAEIAKPTDVQVWVYGLIAVTIINLCTMIGGLLYPCLEKPAFPYILIFFIGLGISSLITSSLLVLLPHALGLGHEHGAAYFDTHKTEDPATKKFIWIGTCCILGIYLFFVIELLFSLCQPAGNQVEPLDESQLEANNTNDAEENANESKQCDKKISQVAMMIIIGDCLHNFVDGITLGSSFAASHLAGISVAIVILFEEFFHELGDFALLLKTGMSINMAMLFNFISGLTNYLGFILGVLISSAVKDAAKWIMGIAAGMFLYIALIEMLADIKVLLKKNGSEKGIWMSKNKLYLNVLFHLGVVIGFVALLLLALYEDDIRI